MQEAREMESKAARLQKELYLPIDQVVARELEEGAETHRVWTMDFGSGKACTLLTCRNKHGRPAHGICLGGL